MELPTSSVHFCAVGSDGPSLIRGFNSLYFFSLSLKGLADFPSSAATLDSTALCRGNEGLPTGALRPPAHLAPGHPEEEQDNQVDGVDNHTGHQANGDCVNTRRDQTGHRPRAMWQERRDLTGSGWVGEQEGRGIGRYIQTPTGTHL